MADYINLRDYLTAFPDRAARYSALKRELALRFSTNRKSYTAAKSRLIDELLDEAREWRQEMPPQ